MAGATPKDTISERLSYSLPKALSVWVQRATRPSNPSQNMATNNAPVVRRFGSQYTPRGRSVGSSSSLMKRHNTRGADVRYAAMRLSQNPISTLKEVPADADVVSHRLMLRTGMIRRLAAGLYVWLPLGLRTLRKVERIVREEMDRAGALELCMPTLQPAELWKESGRWTKYGPELLRFKDRHDREFVYGTS